MFRKKFDGPKQREEIMKIADKRQSIKEEKGVATQKMDDNTSDKDTHVKGVKGEAATASYLGLKVDRDAKAAGDKGYDFKVQGATIEVRTRGEPNRDFAMNDANSYLSTDFGVLCWITDDWIVDVVGWTTKAIFQVQSELLDFGGNMRRGIVYPKMMTIERLHNLLSVR